MPVSVEPMRLVLLADDPEWASLLRTCLSQLKESHQLITAPSWAAASHVFDDAYNAVVLCSPSLRPAANSCPLPIVLLLNNTPEHPLNDADDWLVRDGLNAELVRRCLRYVGERQRLAMMSEQDALTGVANRQGFQRVLSQRLAQGTGRGLLLGHLDLDNFKHVNDSLGFQAGDRLILQVVQRVSAQLLPGESLARLGSDEFALLLEAQGDSQRGQNLAESLLQALSEPYWLDGESLLLGCSLGLAQARLGDSADQLQLHAQMAMQQAKASQGCTYYLYDERLLSGVSRRAEQEAELRRALRRDELVVHYQPRLDISRGRIVGLEALVRWQHPQRGLLGPDEFVPLAEDSGLIIPLGYWVISRALRDMQWLRGRGLPALHMAVNLSFSQFQDSQLQATLERLIAERGVDAQMLEFELTETAVMRRSDQVRQTMQALGRLGVRFSLDDFGTGFSSFVHLNNLPITLLKIDKSFVAQMGTRAENRQLVRAMINLAHNLNLEVVAEGVENSEQLSLLRQYGCDQVQGYLISKPVPLSELARFLVFGVRQPLLGSTGASS